MLPSQSQGDPHKTERITQEKERLRLVGGNCAELQNARMLEAGTLPTSTQPKAGSRMGSEGGRSTLRSHMEAKERQETAHLTLWERQKRSWKLSPAKRKRDFCETLGMFCGSILSETLFIFCETLDMFCGNPDLGLPNLDIHYGDSPGSNEQVKK